MTPEEIDQIGKEFVEGIVEAAMDRLMDEDAFLLTIDAHERTIACRLAMYLQSDLPEWNVDVEYNRLGKGVKRLPNYPNGIYPDIVVHVRGEQAFNLLAVQVKKNAIDGEREDDMGKLNSLRAEPTGYRYALFINNLRPDGNPELVWV